LIDDGHKQLRRLSYILHRQRMAVCRQNDMRNH
jgi:hypothetical protein